MGFVSAHDIIIDGSQLGGINLRGFTSELSPDHRIKISFVAHLAYKLF